ncbi:hypothetical protein [Alicyclobacillus fodiniaquatilis]|uniref:Uncharacterized protein n=1 Tax=Alicyclobacillus fodiniaquatilis TaxID=1661150 RepID=A0ABW4JJK9_9BACL
MSKLISETVKIDQAFAPADISATKTSAYFSMANYRRVLAVSNVASIAEGKTTTIQLMQATDDQGTGAKVLGDAVTVNGAGAAVSATVEAFASDLDDGFTCVAVQIVSTADSPIYGAALLLRGDGRYGTASE